MPKETFGPWINLGLVGRLLTGQARYRAKYICDGPPLAQSSWKFAGYEYQPL